MNEALTKFLKDRRRTLRKSQTQVAEEMGAMQSQFAQWEVNGRLPKNSARIAKMAKALETTPEELLEKAGAKPGNLPNLMPLIKSIALSNCKSIGFDDIEFLQEIQYGLEQPMSPQLIDSLMRHRITTVSPSS